MLYGEYRRALLTPTKSMSLPGGDASIAGGDGWYGLSDSGRRMVVDLFRLESRMAQEAHVVSLTDRATELCSSLSMLPPDDLGRVRDDVLEGA